MAVTALATEVVNLRATPDDRALFDLAAGIKGQSRTQFILGAARVAAMDAVVGRSIIETTPEALQAFHDTLARSPLPNANLRKTLAARLDQIRE
ncbi:MAG: DUF1778 domain-containing protein [Propionibacteriaceae bacterium]|jgi:uncharacterized protein (DUF1778 family)|nr:DUF1778 domain-containing protein [Propionibacteriaceae bacterium]